MLTKLVPLVEWAFAGQVFYSSLIWTGRDTGFLKNMCGLGVRDVCVICGYAASDTRHCNLEFADNADGELTIPNPN